MYNYTAHFIASLTLFTLIAIFFSNGYKKKFFAASITPTLFYIFFYNYDYVLYLGGVTPIIITYFGAFFSCFLFLFFSSSKILNTSKNGLILATNKQISILLPFLAICIQFTLLLYTQSIPWAIDTFPLSNIEAVLFTLFAGTNKGAEEFVISSFWDKVCIPAIKIFLITSFFQLLASILLEKRKIAFSFSLWKIKYFIAGSTTKQLLWQIQKITITFLIIYCGILSLILPSIIMSAPFKALFQHPIDSELYHNHYIQPDSIKISEPNKTMNMIVILLESMETNFAPYTPEIVALEQQSVNFIPGGESVSGTSWTIASITGKLCGIPLNMPMGIDEYLGKLPTYLPGAKCIMDILDKKGFNQIYIQGSSGDFTQKRTFWTIHGNVAVHDIEYYKKTGKIPNDYFTFWGFEDRRLYQFAKEEIDSLYKLSKPFALYMLTIDTHQPEGYVDSICAKEFENIEGILPKAIRCSSKQLYDFIEWAKTQPWFENTIISVMGDHTMPMLSPKVGIPKSDSLYWTNFIINSALKAPLRERKYSSLDMFPTLLEAMGFELKDRGIALGRSLFSDSLTMLEHYGRKTLDSLLRERSIQYDKFLFGQK